GTTSANFSLTTTSTPGGIVYIYDKLSRLKAVVDPASDTAVYNYDAVGNLLSIARQGSSSIALLEFSPQSGPVGTTVTIQGTGFNPTIGTPGTPVNITGTNFETLTANNNVSFNITHSQATSSTATTISTTVPAGTSGRISAGTRFGKAISASDFFIPPGPFDP